jgi:glycosyltransferase involved in cell wall biosynthesis
LNILFIGSSADWHVDLWTRYFTDNHSVYLFSDKEEYLSNQPYKNVTIVEHESLIGRILNWLKIKSHKFHQLNKLLSVKFYAKKVDDCIDEYSIDIVHAHSLYYGYLASFIKSNTPIVFTPMGSDVILHAQNSKIYRNMALKAFSKATIVTGDSLLLQKQGYKVGARADNNYVLQNGVDTNIFFPKKNLLAEGYGVRQDEVLIFSPRGITPIYNIDIIVDTLYQLIKNNYKVKCMFSYAFGDKYSDKIKAKISAYGIDDSFIWLGFLNYTEMADHYNAADIVVSIPSSDSSPKSVYEAMFCKKPIIVTDLEWSNELLGDTECLERVPVREAEKTYRAVAKLIDDTEYRNLLTENGFREAKRHFSYVENMKNMESIMFDVVRGDKGKSDERK